MDPCELSVAGAVSAIERGDLTCERLMGSILEQISTIQPQTNAFISLRDSSDLLEEARGKDLALAREGMIRPLEGIPIGLKDNFATKGFKTTAGSKILADWVPSFDAVTVSRLRAAGAVVVGKLNMHEFANGPTNSNPHYGNPVNPWDPTRTPGGSSGGSAVAVATHMCLAAMGTDTGGSIRTPAAFCGIVGLKPTFGLIPRSGVVPFSWTLDHVGPMTKTVDDAAILLDVLVGEDPGDPATRGQAAGPPRTKRDFDAPLRVGVESSYLNKIAQPGVAAAFHKTTCSLEERGISIEEVEIPALEHSLATEITILFPEAAIIHRDNLEERPADYGEDVRRSLLSGKLYSATDYIEAQRCRWLIKKGVADALTKVDALVMPTVIIEAPKWGQTSYLIESVEYDELNAFIRCTSPFNVTGHPALTVPCGYSPDGLPVGTQIVAGPYQEEMLFALGRMIEDAFKPERRSPSLLRNASA